MTRKMIDSEDDTEILDEIRALEDILAKDDCATSSGIRNDVVSCNLASRRLNVQSRGFGEVTPHRDSTLAATEAVDPRAAYETNKKLIELLQEAKNELLTILEKCVENKAILEEKIRVTANNTKTAKIQIGAAGMPYFKDAKHFFAPKNRDATTKWQNDELQVVQLRFTSPWTPHDRNVLWRSIRQEASAAVLHTEDGDEAMNPSNSDNRQSDTLNLPKNFKAMIGPLDSREFDWLKIAATDFNNRHTPDECRVMWRVFLHPDINRYKWTKEEDANIERLIKLHGRQNWETIASELGTRRSGYQCFIRYNTNNRSSCFDLSPWTSEEDAKLRRCVDKFKIGHYIPWGTVARYMDGRSKGQVYGRWMSNAMPNVKKGRFTADEDAELLSAVAKWGQNFAKISDSVMPNRTSAQLSDHYQTLAQREHGVRNSWSVGEDAMLLKLYAKNGADWSSIASQLPGKTRTQVRHRHKAILRYWDRGISLYSIRRTYDKSETSNAGDTAVIDRCERERDRLRIAKYCSETQNIDGELLKFFHLAPPPAKPGRKQRYYREDELKSTTRILDIILRTLGADLAIPDELDDRTLTEKDKQLLRSLKDYRQLQIEYAKVSSKAVDCARIKLFGSDDNGGRHFAPLCAGDCNRYEKNRMNDTIDYCETRDTGACRVTLETRFDTPKIVIDSIGEEANDEFNRLWGIFRIPETERRRNVFETKYLLEPEGISSKIVNSSRDSQNRGIEREATGATANRMERATARIESGECRIWEGIIHHEDQYSNCVAPSYHTLLGLQHIISARRTTTNTEPSRTSEAPMSERATRSFEVLKKRLLQLFKYPFLLSNLVPPPIYGDNAALLDNHTNVFDDDVDDSTEASVSPAKKRRLTNDAGKTRTKNQRRGRRRK